LAEADRRNNRLQRFTMDGQQIDFVTGFRVPCHFHEQNGALVVVVVDVGVAIRHAQIAVGRDRNIGRIV
jgi:hypothetical protein